MKLAECRFLADANIDPEVVEGLRVRGHDVLSLRELGLAEQSDDEVVRIAFAQGRIVITHDADFGELAVARGEQIVGILFLRPGHISAPFVLATFDAVCRTDPVLKVPFILVARRSGDDVAIRIRVLA